MAQSLATQAIVAIAGSSTTGAANAAAERLQAVQQFAGRADAMDFVQVGTVPGHLVRTCGKDRYRAAPLPEHHIFAEKGFHD